MNTETEPFTIAGSYLDSNRGHYMARDVVKFANENGFLLDWFEEWAVDSYEQCYGEDEYPFEGVVDLAELAIEWLNSDEDSKMKMQNLPPAKPADTLWGYNEGDFGLWSNDDE